MRPSRSCDGADRTLRRKNAINSEMKNARIKRASDPGEIYLSTIWARIGIGVADS